MEKHGRINIFVNVLLSGILSLITAFAGMLPSIIQHGGYFVSKADYITQQILNECSQRGCPTGVRIHF